MQKQQYQSLGEALFLEMVGAFLPERVAAENWNLRLLALLEGLLRVRYPACPLPDV